MRCWAALPWRGTAAYHELVERQAEFLALYRIGGFAEALRAIDGVRRRGGGARLAPGILRDDARAGRRPDRRFAAGLERECMSPRKSDAAHRRHRGAGLPRRRSQDAGPDRCEPPASSPLPRGRWPAPTSIGLITGFFVPRGDVAAPETDGPVGTALLAAALGACGVPVRIAVDSPCADAVRAAVARDRCRRRRRRGRRRRRPGIERVAAAWRGAGVSHAVAIERCGRSADGRPRNMRGVDVSPWTAPLDDLFLAGAWVQARRSATAATRSAWASCRPA